MRYLRTWPKRQKANLRVLFPKGDAQALDLLDKLLAFDPEKRITAAESLKHPYLSTYHIPDDEPDHERLFDFSFESASTIDQIKCIIAKEVDSFVKNEALPAAEMASPKRTE
jgi:serine/threonine protein kinase